MFFYYYYGFPCWELWLKWNPKYPFRPLLVWWQNTALQLGVTKGRSISFLVNSWLLAVVLIDTLPTVSREEHIEETLNKCWTISVTNMGLRGTGNVPVKIVYFSNSRIKKTENQSAWYFLIYGTFSTISINSIITAIQSFPEFDRFARPSSFRSGNLKWLSL